MLINELKSYAQDLFDKGNSQEDIQVLVSKKFKEEDITNEDGSKVDIKDFKLELEEKAVEEKEDIEITVKKAVEKEVKSNKSQKIVLPRIEYVNRPTKCFADIKLAEQAGRFLFTKDLAAKLGSKALTTYSAYGTDSDGGSMDINSYSAVLVDLIPKYNPYLDYALRVPMNGSTGSFIARGTGAVAYMTDEVTASTQTKVAIPTKTVTAKKIHVSCPITNDMLRYNNLGNIADEVTISMARAIAKKQTHLMSVADGTADANDLSTSGFVAAIAAVSNNKSIYTFNGNWTELDADTIPQIIATLDPTVVDWANCIWTCSMAMWAYLEAIARTNGSSYVVNTGTKPQLMLYGFPVIINNLMNTSFSEDTIGLAFGDLRSTVAYGMPYDTMVSVHPDTYAEEDATLYKATCGFGVNVYNPGTSSVAGGSVVVKFSDAS